VNVLQAIVDGMALGAVYALVAVGLALVFGVLRLINFAHGELITAGGYTLALTAAFPRVASVAITLVVCVAAAFVMERVAFRRLRGVSEATTLVATFAVAFALQGVWLIAFGPEGRTADVLAPLNNVAIGGDLDVRWVTLVMLAVGGALLAGTALMLNRTGIGLQMRAAAADFRAARLLGVRADAVIGFAFVIAGVLAAAVAILLTVQRPLVTPTFGLQVVILALVGVVVGGIDRLGSATLGGFTIGFAVSVLGDLLPAQERVFLPSFVFLLVIVTLLLRPSGLFAHGRQTAVERV
jgi:branched-chain amino acid transport system permease protein